ncbi:hypothetical protein Pla110_37740 [Polystyrenella longa]|uniref:Uncharacterized protein n=1 Tax=Polystyrenella longa TaxID=2528007 RepID=A0A518CS15_9PLAN|nr:hypothetical protein [Polystyrenella longa]QDU82021.1 hypothetical protein Pla110_37740 [Polystyrenella longa]
MRYILLLLLLLTISSGCEKPAAVQKEPSQADDLANRLLNEELDEQQRRDLFPEYPQLAAEIVSSMTKDYPWKEEGEEYRRIPWIWRVSVNATKTLNEEEIRELLEVGLPELGEPMADWESVVIGGAVINGLTLKGKWPREFLRPILEQNTDLLERWNQMLEQSLEMADDTNVKTGTRYDALRNIGMLSWEEGGANLTKYLTASTDPELKQGAIGGLADMHSAAADNILLSGWVHYNDQNRFFALEGMLRTADRFRRLNQEIEAGRVDPGFLSDDQKQKLLTHPHEITRQHAYELLKRPEELAGEVGKEKETIPPIPEAETDSGEDAPADPN